MISFMDIFRIHAIVKPLQKIVFISRLDHWSNDNKEKLIMRYIGNEFIDSMKFKLLINKEFGNIYSTKVTKTSDSNKKNIELIMANKEEYLFKIRKRDKNLDYKNSSRWVIYDICGAYFNE